MQASSEGDTRDVGRTRRGKAKEKVINSLESMSKRTPEDAGEERVTAKSKPMMMNLVSRYSVKDPNVFASAASESLEKTKS